MPYIKPNEFYAQIKSNKIEPVYIFAGEEIYLQQEALKALSKAMEVNDLNYETFYGQQNSVDDIVLATQTLPLLSDKRLVVIKDAHKIKAADLNKLAPYLTSDSSSSTCIVFLWTDKLRAESKKNAFFQAADKSGAVVEFRAMYERELPPWVIAKVNQSGKKISFDAVQYLIQESGASLMDLANEIDKLALFLKDKKEITLADIETLSGHTKQLNLNNLAEAIEAKNLQESLKTAESLLNEGEIPLKLLSTIYWTIRKLLIAKIMIEENKLPESQVRQEVRIHPYFFNKFIANLNNYSLDELKNALSYILECDRQLKSSSKPHNMIFEELLFSLLSKRKKPQALPVA